MRDELGPYRKTFESSPPYLYSPLAPNRIHDLLPDVRLIFLLRNPTERTISHYFHRHRARKPLGIEGDLAEEAGRALSGKDFEAGAFRRFFYMRRGHYCEQIARFRKYFPPHQMLILNSERFFAEPQGSLRRVLEFVGADPGFAFPDLAPRNVGSRQDVDPHIYGSLDAYFAPYNHQLYDMLGVDFGW